MQLLLCTRYGADIYSNAHLSKMDVNSIEIIRNLSKDKDRDLEF